MLRIFIVIFLFAWHVEAKTLSVVSTTTDLAWMVKEIGGDLVKSEPLLSSGVDPHFADAVPEYIRLVANADVVCFVGLKLEVGWLPKVLDKSGNAKVQSGGEGHCDTGKGVKPFEVPTQPIDRSMGDVHGSGNPHFQLSPEHMLQAGEVILSSLIAVDSKNAETYAKRFEKLKGKILAAKVKVNEYIKAQKGTKLVMEYHKEFTYFFKSYGIESFGAVEEIPGVPPSAGRIATVALKAKQAGVNVVLAAPYNPHNVLSRFSEISHIKYKVVPVSIELKGEANDFSKLQMAIAKAIYE